MKLVTNNHSNKNRTAKRSFFWRLFHTKKPITTNAMVRPPIITPSAIWAISSIGDEGQRFDLRFFRPVRADLSIRKSSSFFPPLIAATSQRGLAPRPAQVSPDGPRYFGGTFLPRNALLLKLRTTLKKHFVNPLSQVHQRFNAHP